MKRKHIISFAMPGINKLDFTISYDSRNTEQKGDMGYGWYHNYESRIEECGNGIRVYWNPNSYVTFANSIIYLN